MEILDFTVQLRNYYNRKWFPCGIKSNLSKKLCEIKTLIKKETNLLDNVHSSKTCLFSFVKKNVQLLIFFSSVHLIIILTHFCTDANKYWLCYCLANEFMTINSFVETVIIGELNVHTLIFKMLLRVEPHKKRSTESCWRVSSFFKTNCFFVSAVVHFKMPL